MVGRGRLHRVHPLATGRNVPSTQLRLLVHTVGGNSSAGSVLSSLKLFVATALEILADVQRRSPDASVAIKRSHSVSGTIRSYLIVRVRDDARCLNRVSAALFRRPELSVLLVVEETGRIWRRCIRVE